jgi:hypothetical protein
MPDGRIVSWSFSGHPIMPKFLSSYRLRSESILIVLEYLGR